jgi:voltage-gated potassium channel
MVNKNSIKFKIFDLIDPSMANDKSSRIFNGFMIVLIIVNITSVILETERSIFFKFPWVFIIIDTVSLMIFAIEYILRVWTCTYNEEFKDPILGRIKYIFTPAAIIDLISFLPMLIPVFGLDLRVLRAFRLSRIFRVLKLNRYSDAIKTLGNIFNNKKAELGITLMTGFIVLLIGSSIMYYVENPIQPETFSSIPASLWWGVATLTTVGYGDIYPKTALGKMLGSMIAIVGIGLFALPAGIIASGFISELQKPKKQKKICPHCGKEFEE